jgi:hypothetical protein
MSSAPLPSLGDEVKPKMSLVQEERALPGNRKELVSVFENILSQGGVQKVVIELGRPIKISRFTKEGAPAPESLREEDLFLNVRNAEMQEFVLSESLPMTDYLFRAFHLLNQKRLKPRAFLLKNFPLLRECLGVDITWDLGDLFGVDVVKSDSVPEDVLLLSAAPHGDDEEVTLSLRMLMIPTRRK